MLAHLDSIGATARGRRMRGRSGPALHACQQSPGVKWTGVEWSGYIGRIPCSSKSSKSTPQASQPAFSTSESAPAYFFERDCFVDSFWGALGSDFGPYPSQNAPKSDPRAPKKPSTKHSRSKKYAGAESEVEKACCEAWGVDFEDFELHGILPI